MDFIENKSEIVIPKVDCDIKKYFDIHMIVWGHGGSENINLIVTDSNKKYIVLKIMPSRYNTNRKIEPNNQEIEIKFHKFFNIKYILNNRTPHIIGMYDHQICDDISVLLNGVKRNQENCPTIDKLLVTKNVNFIDQKICEAIEKCKLEIYKPKVDILFIEYCQYDMKHIIELYMEDIKINEGIVLDEIVIDFIYQLHRIIFQLIFTLAIIKDDYPGYFHGDLFMRNILLSHENNYLNTDYVAYHYKQKIFYFPANGVYSKITDFGESVILNELEPVTFKMEEKFRKLNKINPFNKKNDIFNILHSLYDGQNLGFNSIMKCANDMKINHRKIYEIVNFMNLFIDIKTIDKINNINGNLLDSTWYIDGYNNFGKVCQNTT